MSSAPFLLKLSRRAALTAEELGVELTDVSERARKRCG